MKKSILNATSHALVALAILSIYAGVSYLDNQTVQQEQTQATR